MNNTQRKLCSKYMKLAERNQKHADELKSHMSGMTSYGGWDVGYHTGYSTGVSNLIDELLAAESEKEGNSES